jgi:hypothetical protein
MIATCNSCYLTTNSYCFRFVTEEFCIIFTELQNHGLNAVQYNLILSKTQTKTTDDWYVYWGQVGKVSKPLYVQDIFSEHIYLFIYFISFFFFLCMNNTVLSRTEYMYQESK